MISAVIGKNQLSLIGYLTMIFGLISGIYLIYAIKPILVWNKKKYMLPDKYLRIKGDKHQHFLDELKTVELIWIYQAVRNSNSERKDLLFKEIKKREIKISDDIKVGDSLFSAEGHGVGEGVIWIGQDYLFVEPNFAIQKPVILKAGDIVNWSVVEEKHNRALLKDQCIRFKCIIEGENREYTINSNKINAWKDFFERIKVPINQT